MVHVSLVQKSSAFTLILIIYKNWSCLVPVALLPVRNRNVHISHCIVVNGESLSLSEKYHSSYFSCVHSIPASSTGFFTWKYHMYYICIMRGSRYLCTLYCHVWDGTICAKYSLWRSFQKFPTCQASASPCTETAYLLSFSKAC